MAGTAFTLILHLSSRPTAKFTPATVPSEADLQQHRTAGAKAFGERDFRAAALEFGQARDCASKVPTLLSAVELRLLTQQQREAALLADWPREHVGPILFRAERLNEEEWRSFWLAKKGKSLTFHLKVRRDAAGHCTIDYLQPQGDVPWRLELENLKLLERLPLDDPKELLLGGRLAEVQRDRGTCIIKLEPDSGVLLTEPVSAEWCLLEKPDDALRALLAQQKTWVVELP